MYYKPLVAALVLLLACSVVYAQSAPMKWGKIDKQDLDMKVYPLDTTAAAVVLGDFGEAYFGYDNDKGFYLNVKRHVRIKILKTEGLEQANQAVVLYNSNSRFEEEIHAIKGVTYNPGSDKEEKTKISKNDIFVEEVNERYNRHKFTLPNVKVGSIIEFEYHKTSPFIFGLETWVFQTTIPTRWSEFRARIPEYYGYKQFMSGYNSPVINEQEGYQDSFNYRGESMQGAGGHIEKYSGTLTPNGTKYRWAMKDVPALKEEAYITTLNDYASKIEFELNYTKFPWKTMEFFHSDWQKLSKEFLEDSRFGGELKKHKQVSELVKGLTAGKATPEEKMGAIYSFVQQNIRYNQLERVFMSGNFKEILAKKEGNSADINLTLTAMLREAGLVANPVILSTRQNGMVNPVVPLAQNFNYVVCQVAFGADAYVLLDATDSFLPMGTLPYRCMNDRGRLVAETHTDWVTLLNKERNSSMIKASLKILANGSMAGSMLYSLDGFEAASTRRKLLNDGEDKYLEGLAGEKGHWQIKEHKVENLKNLGSRLEEHFTLEMRDRAMPAGDKLYVNLLPEGVLESNPFKMDDRKFPINFGCPLDKMLVYELELPDGYVVEQMPKPAIINLPDKSGVFRYSVTQQNNKIHVTSTLQIKKPVFASDEYQYLKELYQLMLAKQNEQLVLTKKN